jgi:putative spermidine/putrescine transport system ATP-binding protein
VQLGTSKIAINQFEALVEERIYFGDHSKLRLSFEGTTSFMARCSFKDGLDAVKKGDKVTVSWDVDSCRAVKPEL